MVNRKIKHGDSYKRIYRIWVGMKGRCYNKNYVIYFKYGGRGIVMCDDWKNNYISFRDWSYKNGYNNELTIDRIDNNKGYYPANCRWRTYQEQNTNTRMLKTNMKILTNALSSAI